MHPAAPRAAAYGRVGVCQQRTGTLIHWLINVLNASTGRNSATDHKYPNMVLPRTFDSGFAIGLMAKDLRLALEVAHRAMVDAGYPHDRAGTDHSRTGVVFGAEAGSDMGHAQTLRTMLPAYLGDVPPELEDQLPTVTEDSFPGVLANVIAGRVANLFNFRGPNFTTDAACA